MSFRSIPAHARPSAVASLPCPSRPGFDARLGSEQWRAFGYVVQHPVGVPV